MHMETIRGVSVCSDPMSYVTELLRPSLARPRIGAILLPVSTTSASERLTKAAAAVADRHSASLAALACACPADRCPETAAEQDAVELLLEASGRRFDALTRQVRAGREWRRCEGPVLQALRSNAWRADLLMVGALDVRHEGPRFHRIRTLLRETGVPLLVWPDSHRPSDLAHAAVLFDSSPAAARAVRAAAPVLLRCRRISLVSTSAQAIDLKRSLEARGVPEVRIVPLRSALSHLAAQALAETAADIDVVGAWSEPFGGWPKRSVTELLLTDLRAPLLLAA